MFVPFASMRRNFWKRIERQDREYKSFQAAQIAESYAEGYRQALKQFKETIERSLNKQMVEIKQKYEASIEVVGHQSAYDFTTMEPSFTYKKIRIPTVTLAITIKPAKEFMLVAESAQKIGETNEV